MIRIYLLTYFGLNSFGSLFICGCHNKF